MRALLLIIILAIIPLHFTAQDLPERQLDALSEYPLRRLLLDLEKVFHVQFNYLDTTVEGKSADIQGGKYTLPQILQLIENQLPVRFIKSDSDEYLVIYQKKENIEAGKSSVISDNGCILNKTEQLEGILLQGYLSLGISKSKDQSFFIQPYRLGIIPGMTDPDVFISLRHLPGVTSINETATDLNVRGGDTDQNLILWDGIPMWQSGHLFGMITAFNPNIKQDVHFYNKGTPPRLGDKISSSIQIETNNKIPAKTEIDAGANALSADVFAGIPLVKNKIALQVSGRRSFTDFLPSPTLWSYHKKVFEFSNESRRNIGRAPGDPDNKNKFFYQDYYAKLNYRPNERTLFYITSILIDSYLDNINETNNSNVEYRDRLHTNNYGYGLNWEQEWTAVFRHKLNVFSSQYDLNYINDRKNIDRGWISLDKNNTISQSGINYETRLKLGHFGSFTNGYAYNIIGAKYLYKTTTDLYELTNDSRVDDLKSHVFYSAYEYYNHRKIALMGGVRYQIFTGRARSSFEPRYSIRFPIYKKLFFTHTGEYKSQAVNQIKETIFSEIGLENQLWALTNGQSIPIVRAKDFSWGLTYKKRRWILDGDFYTKKITGLSSRALSFSDVVDKDKVYLGERRIKGIDIFIKKEFEHLNIWTTYTWNDIEDYYEGLNNDLAFTSSNEIKHSFDVSVAYKSKDYKLAAGWHWNTGKPYTDAEGKYDEYNLPYWEYHELNGERLPDYHSLDISGLYKFYADEKHRLHAKAGFSIHNLYNRINLIDIIYHSVREPNGKIVKIEQHALGFTPNVFFRISF